MEIDTSLVASHVTVLKNYPFIGMMGYAAGENPLSYPEVKYTMVLQLIHAAAKLVDFVILDCSTSMTNVFTLSLIHISQLFLGCTDQLTAEFISARTGLASVAVSSKSKQLGTWRISNYTPELDVYKRQQLHSLPRRMGLHRQGTVLLVPHPLSSAGAVHAGYLSLIHI